MVMYILQEYSPEIFMREKPCLRMQKSRCHLKNKCKKSTEQQQPEPKLNQDKFEVCMDVRLFSPEDITVKTIQRDIIVEAKHEEREDDQGIVSRHFVRRYNLPEGYRPEDVTSSLSSNGILSITVPKAPSPSGDRIVPITATGPIRVVTK